MNQCPFWLESGFARTIATSAWRCLPVPANRLPDPARAGRIWPCATRLVQAVTPRPQMHLEGLLEHASRHVVAVETGHRSTRLMQGLMLLQQDSPSSLDVSLYEPVLCLILQGRKQVSIGEQTLSFGPGECLLVSHDL